MKTLFIYSLCILCSVTCFSQKKDFGAGGLKGLSAQQKDELNKGEVVLLNDGKGEGNNSLIEAAIVFNATPDMTWKLVSKTDDQPLYISQCKEIKVVSKAPKKAIEVHTVGTALITFKYGVIETYDASNKYIHWTLDPNYEKNDLDALNGYWQFFLYGKGKTLARYGSQVSFKKIPEFVENMFKKDGVTDALASVKKYVDSGGTYRK